MRSRFKFPTGSFNDGIDDVLIAGAAAEIARYRLAHLGIGERTVVAQQSVGGQQKSRRAKTALQRVMLLECLLQ